MGQVGTMHGVRWMRKPLRDVFPHLRIKAEWYFPLGDNGEPDGNHYRTLREMERALTPTPPERSTDAD